MLARPDGWSVHLFVCIRLAASLYKPRFNSQERQKQPAGQLVPKRNRMVTYGNPGNTVQIRDRS
jgi:hypothetical protein